MVSYTYEVSIDNFLIDKRYKYRFVDDVFEMSYNNILNDIKNIEKDDMLFSKTVGATIKNHDYSKLDYLPKERIEKLMSKKSFSILHVTENEEKNDKAKIITKTIKFIYNEPICKTGKSHTLRLILISE